MKLSKTVTTKQVNKIEEKMSIQGNLQKLKKAQTSNKNVYLTYANFEEISGKVADIGNVFVHIATPDNDEPVALEIEKIVNISLLRKSC